MSDRAQELFEKALQMEIDEFMNFIYRTAEEWSTDVRSSKDAMEILWPTIEGFYVGSKSI